MDIRIEIYETLKEMKSYALKLTRNEQDAEDLIQDTGVKAIRKVDSFNPNKAKMNTWLAHIMKNIYIDGIRKKRPDLVNDSNMGEDGIEDRHELIKSSHNNGSNKLDYDDIVNVIKSNINSDRDIEILSMKNDGYKLKDIAQHFNIETNAVKQVLYKIKTKLKDKL